MEQIQEPGLLEFVFAAWAALKGLLPVWLQGGMVGLEIEELPDGTVAVFLPSVPAVTLGQVHIVPADRISAVSASLHAALEYDFCAHFFCNFRNRHLGVRKTQHGGIVFRNLSCRAQLHRHLRSARR